MTAQELLLVFVVQVLNNEQTTDRVYKSVFFGGMEMNGVWVLAIVTYGVLHLD